MIIPIVFHNLRGYDSHLLMQAISKVEGKISCIPNNMEKYISFSLGKLRFIDSTKSLLGSLDRLVKVGKPEYFKITANYELNAEERQMLLRKAGSDLQSPFHQKKPFTASSTMKTSARTTTKTRSKSGQASGVKTWVTTTTSIYVHKFSC